MKRKSVFLLLIVLVSFSLTVAQETQFGKNKVQYRSFKWNYIQTNHFDIHFYDGEYELAKFAANELELSYDIVAGQLKYYVARRIPVFLYNSHNDFQQTNITWQYLGEGTQGFTEVFKNRIVVHFMGSYEEFRHLLHHELTHAVIFDLIYGQFFKSLLNPNRLFELPLWFAEGYAEYSSNGGWTIDADMKVRDATINGYLAPPDYMEFLAYSEGFALVKYIVDNYGMDKLGEILSRGKAMYAMDRALKASIGMNSEELYDKFSKEMKKRYWPDIALREEPKDFAKQLTKHGKDGSHYNEKPVFSPKGQVIAMITDRSGYSEIVLISAIDGKKIGRLVKGERSADLESLRWYTSGMSFSPDGEKLVFVSKSKGEDAINFLTIKNKDIELRKKFGLKSIISPAWSAQGDRIVFSALAGASRNLYIYDLETDSLSQLTDDLYDELDVAWYPDGRRIIFSTDRPHPADYAIIDTTEFTYGVYNLHAMNLETGDITPIPVGPGQNREPVISSDGEKIAFVSDRNGIENIYVYYIDSGRVIAATNALTNAKSPTWSADGKMLAFSTFYKGGYDIYLIKDIKVKGDNGVLSPTAFVMGEYDNKVEWARVTDDIDLLEETEIDTTIERIEMDDPDFPAAVRQGQHGWGREHDPDVTEENEADSGVAPNTAIETSTVEADSAKTADADTDDNAEPIDEEDEEYVYTAPAEESVFEPEGDLTFDGEGERYVRKESVDSLSADSLDNVTDDGRYRVRPYKTRFTPDIISGGLQYDSFFGFRGQTVFLFSDYLGDHQILVATDLVNTIDQSNIQLYYFFNKLRIDLGIGLFHTKNFYGHPERGLFSDRFYGMLGSLAWPRSKFTRIELNGAAFLIDRRYFEGNPPPPGRHVRITTAALSWIHDTVLWGITGPVNGRRYRLTLEAATPIFGTESINYYSAELDYRQYFPIGRTSSFAIRISGGLSNGSQPKNYFLGGSTNKIGTISVAADVYNEENLYFSTVVTPLRGYDYYDLVGTRYTVTNLELHFPFIEYFLMRYPLRLGLSRVTGALFMDMGATWNDDDDFKGGTKQGGSRLLGIKTGFGLGARANLGFLVLRYDLAWRTNFHSVEPHTKHYFSLGADF